MPNPRSPLRFRVGASNDRELAAEGESFLRAAASVAEPHSGAGGGGATGAFLTLYSNQFPDGLVLKIYSYTLEGGQSSNRDDLREINSLNHYIGMRPLLESDFSEFKWLPFGLGAFVLLALRAIAFGKMSKLVDLVVLFLYFTLFSLWSFGYRLYQYGHVLDPTAAIKVAPFTPPLIGTQQIANFTVNNYPGPATYLITASLVLMIVALMMSARQRT
jgi:copper chaperone NosL